MTRGLVSVIIPTYNRADYVVEAIRSAKAQTYPLKEIIVVDDGSCDDTALRVAEVGGVEYHYKTNRGQGAARNHGLRLARGEYIASLDSDDLWNRDFLVSSVECLETHQLDFVFTNWTKVRGSQSLPSEWLRDGKWRKYQTRRHAEWSLLDAAEVRKLFLKICPAPSSSVLIRRDAIVSGWGEHMQIADDWYMILEMALHRPCTAAFSLTPRWRKRIDGKNVYDGRPFAEAARKLHLHDCPAFRRDFRSLLSRQEKFRLARRDAAYCLRLLLDQSVKTDLAARLKIPAIIARLRDALGTFTNNLAGGGLQVARRRLSQRHTSFLSAEDVPAGRAGKPLC
jgi:glycosyltransferase involved in cell wall biosynthesis